MEALINSTALAARFSVSSAEVRLVAVASASMPAFTDTRFVITTQAVPILTGTRAGDYEIVAPLMGQVVYDEGQWVATTWLEREIMEYGMGDSPDAALSDLIIAIGDARESMERRADKLGDSAALELEVLRRFVRRTGD